METAPLYNDDAVIGYNYAEPGAMYPDWRGINYDPDLSIVEIAKIIRTEIRAAIRLGALNPITKVSVTKHGTSIQVSLTMPRAACEVTESTPGVYWSPMYGWALVGCSRPWMLRPAFHAVFRVERFVDSFNRDQSNSQLDYFHKCFWENVSLNLVDNA